MTWLFTSNAGQEEFPTKKAALAWVREAGWKPWAGKREVIVFTRGVEAAGLRKTDKGDSRESV